MKLTIIDTAALTESLLKSGVWKLLPDGSTATDDGVHPNAVTHAFIEKNLGPKIQAAVLQETLNQNLSPSKKGTN